MYSEAHSIAKEWLIRGKQVTDPFYAIADFWRGFNYLYSSISDGDERAKIKKYLGLNITNEQAQEMIDGNASNIKYLLSEPVIDMRVNGKDTSQNIITFNSVTDPKAKVAELFMIIYQVRCNLEHGQKSPNRHRDACLCACAVPVISYVLECNA